jgi:flagellar motility protein MotE (MotC chaperone)
VNLSKEFMNKERALELRELEIQKKVESLKVSEADLAKKIKEFKGRSDKLLGCLDEHDRNQNKRVNHMVDVVSGMRPQNAADVLSVQDVDIAVRILGSLAPEKVSKIFNSSV